MSLTVLRPGMLTTVQDLGRYGYQKYGVVAGGALDTGAARVANLLVGNDDREAVLEITLGGASFAIDRPMIIAVSGGDLSATLDGSPLPLWRPVYAKAGSVLSFGACASGCRTYLAAGGGFDVPEVMGSRSTYLRGAVGGFAGRALKADDELGVRPPNGRTMRLASLIASAVREDGLAAASWHASHFAVAGSAEEQVVRAVPGTHYDRFTLESREALFGQSYRIGAQSDRMGCRLEGETKLLLSLPLELLSEAVALGTVQAPPDGDPIVLLADRQTTGGYPRIAQVASVDIAVLAQLKPGSRFRFEAIAQTEAERLYVAGERDLRLLRAAVSLKLRPLA
ncbi:5-oxoprolinase subunit C family protein [Paenibacillus arenilitoris]|uniref:Biotin-dependent carboxyltransferase family protein n=1 Tax=Paenibacillus arenilitoris TaxID=2772299 RepID=A0A927CR95_9BACL|nr:biotin-dependent carboxyltransferase family protein [Paenibacillus arenilitoris]MBD2872698.1 biotin-dependent carboxyltransferase family protein [Paenibacillus arenilitoris]